ncbi:MAG TPA: hypothetical protein VGK25_05150 [Ignavibacteria bacterium]|jgi:hypothetical protein
MLPNNFNAPIEEISQSRKHHILVLKIDQIEMEHSLKVHDLLMNATTLNELDVILQTNGGDINSAYQIIKFLRNYAKKVFIIIPYYAKSAGTLICLGGDEILLAGFSELGPLDTQIYEEQGGTGSEYVSALNGFKALESIQLHCVETLDTATLLIYKRSGLKVAEAFELANKFTGKTSGKLYSQLNAYKLGYYSRALGIGEHYAKQVLTRYMKWDAKPSADTVKKLVTGYPSHDFVIDVDELVSLKLPAKMIDSALLKSICTLRDLIKKYKGDLIEFIEFKDNSQKEIPEKLKEKLTEEVESNNGGKKNDIQ